MVGSGCGCVLEEWDVFIFVVDFTLIWLARNVFRVLLTMKMKEVISKK